MTDLRTAARQALQALESTQWVDLPRHQEEAADKAIAALRAALAEPADVSELEALRDANERFGVRQGWWMDRMFDLEHQRDKLRAALELIATPRRPDGTWNRDREACRQIAAEALRP